MNTIAFLRSTSCHEVQNLIKNMIYGELLGAIFIKLFFIFLARPELSIGTYFIKGAAPSYLSYVT